MITDSDGNPGVAASERRRPGGAQPAARSVLAGTRSTGIRGSTATTASCPYQWSWSVGVSHQLFANAAVSVDYVANVSRDQLGVIDINEPVNGVRPGVDVFDPTGELIPAEARGTPLPARAADADRARVRRRLQVAAVLVRQADVEPLERPRSPTRCRRATTSASATPTRGGSGSTTTSGRDYGRFASDRRHVLRGERHLQPVAVASRSPTVRQRHLRRADQRDRRHATSTATTTTTTGRSGASTI